MTGKGVFHGNNGGQPGQRQHLGNRKTSYNHPQQSIQGSSVVQQAPYSYSNARYPATTYQQQGRTISWQKNQPNHAAFPQRINWPSPIHPEHLAQQQYHTYPQNTYPQPLPAHLRAVPLSVQSNPPLLPIYPPGPPVPVYLQSQPKQPQTQQNSYGYTLSSTAYSLPSHHFQPHVSEQPDLSEEELRFALEQQIKKKAPVYASFPIQLLT